MTVPIAGSVAGTGRSVASVTSRTTRVNIGSITTSVVGARRVTLYLSPNGISSNSAYWLYSFILAECSISDNGTTLTVAFRVRRNGIVVWEQYTANAVAIGGTSVRLCPSPIILDTQGAGVTASYTLEIVSTTSGSATNMAHEVMNFTYVMVESKR